MSPPSPSPSRSGGLTPAALAALPASPDLAATGASGLRHRRLGETLGGPALVALDATLAAVVLALFPLTWELPERAPVAVPLVLAFVAGIWLFGGHRAPTPASTRVARLTAIGGTLGLVAAWAVLKLLSAKFGLWRLIPPDAAGLALAAMTLVATASLARLPWVAWLRRRESRMPIHIIGPDTARTALATRLGQGHAHVPLVTTPPDRVPTLVDVRPLRAVVLATPASTLSAPSFAALVRLRALGVRITTPAALEEALCARIPLIDDDPWFLHDETLGRPRETYLSAKRLLDVVGAIALSLVTLPALVAVALAIRITSRGPVLIRQTRAGLNMKPFVLLKFRSMHPNAEATSGPTWATPDDPRVTRIGRFLRRTRLDELPQLWNVLRGDMSLVGPRPERPEFDAVLAARLPFYTLRHLARPGLTGWAQVHAPYSNSVDDVRTKLEHDLYYLKHASLMLDLRILMQTIPVVLTRRGH